MVDIASVVKEFPGATPYVGLDDCWIWSAGRFHFVLALTADGRHALQINCRGALDLDLATAVLSFARARTEAVLAAAPLAVLEGFTSPTGAPFDSVAAVIPAVHHYHDLDEPELHEVTYAVFPAYRCEFSGLETQEEAAYRFARMLDPANLQRPPSPWVRMRFDNPKTRVGSIGPELGIAPVETLMRELENLANADDAFVEFENFRGERRLATWSGGLRLAREDGVSLMEMTDLLEWAHRFIYEGIDSAT